MSSINQLLTRGENLPEGRREAEVLLCHCLKKPRSYLYAWPEKEVSGEQLEQYLALLKQRLQGTPIAYLTGSREFWSMQLKVNRQTLIPRADTETLVTQALALKLPDQSQVLDLGTGSGAIALALASERPHWQVCAVDISEAALAVAADNAARHSLPNVSFAVSDWYAAIAQRRFHLIVSNPPYISPDDQHLDQGDLRFEPHQALVANQEGLADIYHLVQQARPHLFASGWFITEHGCDQGASVRQALREAGFEAVQTVQDLSGLDRVTLGSAG